MEAAAEADRQLGLADLLGTAVMIRRRQTPQPWDEAVMVCADKRCRGLSVSSVLLQRWGARAWGGVALSTCLVVVLSLILTQPAPSQAGTSIVADPFAMAGREASGAAVPRPSGRTVVFDAAGRPPPLRGQQTEDRGDGSSERNVASKSAIDSGSAAGTPGGANADPAGGGGSKSAVGTGARSSLPQGSDAAGAKSAGSQDHGRSAAAGGAADAGAGQSGVAAGQTAAAGASGRVAAAPSWNSDGWPRDQQERLDEQLRSRAEYEAYRDLIRAYFERE
jgi:hypothetical protein